MRRRLFAAVALGAAIAAACSSFSSDEPASSSTEDGGTDGAVASADGTTPATDAGGPFCPQPDADFCWAFDEGSDPLVGPSLHTVSPPPPVLSNTAKSPPNAMAVSVLDGGASGVSLDVGGPVSRIRCEFDLMMESPAPGAPTAASIAFFDYAYSMGYHPLLRAMTQPDGRVELALVVNSDPDVTIGNLPTGEWVHLALESSAAGDNAYQAKARLELAGSAAIEKTTGASFDGGGLGTLPRFEVMFGVGAPGGAWTVHYDNLVCRWQ